MQKHHGQHPIVALQTNATEKHHAPTTSWFEHTLDGEKLWYKFGQVKRDIGKDYENSLPSNLHANLPSGHSLHAMYDAFIMGKFKADKNNMSK